MATNGKNLEPEFDALLKAHVKQHTNVAVCAQFDPDSATAYLEQALSQAAQTSFETHLASCTVCRRHLIELSRLMPAPVSLAEPMVVRATFKDRVSEWLSGWRLGAVAGFGAMAATLLLVAVVVNRNASEDAALTMVAKQNEVSASSLPEPSAKTLSSEFALGEERLTASSSPVPNVTVWGSKDAVKPTPAEPLAGAAAAPPAKAAESVPPPPPAPTPAPSKAESERKELAAAPPAAGAAPSQTQANNFRAQTPSGPAANQMQAERALELRKRNEQAAQTTDSVASVSKPVAKPTEPKAERQDEQRKDAVADEAAKKRAVARPAAAPEKVIERPARPERVIAGKTFRQESGVWVDAAYEANRNLPIVRLTRDSEAYQQTLKDTPALKPYFDLKPVVVVWQGKVYRVENK